MSWGEDMGMGVKMIALRREEAGELIMSSDLDDDQTDFHQFHNMFRHNKECKKTANLCIRTYFYSHFLKRFVPLINEAI